MLLSNVLVDINYTISKKYKEVEEVEIKDISYNSRNSNEGTLFVAIKGETVDGHRYVGDAYDRGCRTFIIQDDVELPDDVTVIKVESPREALSKASANFFGNPSKELTIIGITGTKGKTTISNYVSSVLNASGVNTGVIGTNGTFYNGKTEKTANTTPESYELQRIFRTMVDDGVKCVAMEVSSGGLMMNRVNNIDFDIALFTNIFPDHIGPKEHPTFEHYLECKSRLFKMCKFGIINADANHAEYIVENATCETTTFSIDNKSDLMAEEINFSNNLDTLGVSFYYTTENESKPCYICSPGTFSIYNALSVIAICKHMGIDEKVMIDALANANVDGRVQVLPVLDYATVIVDYAHNGISLENLLTTLKQYNPNRLICLFGSVGGRTKLRRKELGDIAAKYADYSILTGDNPDFEPVEDILDDIAKSFSDKENSFTKIGDREEAIRYAINIAQEGDIIVLAGKGHEKYQLINGEHVPFDEVAIAKDEADKISNK